MDITKIYSFFSSQSQQFRKLTVYCLVVLLSACASTPNQTTTQNEHSADLVESLLTQASTAPPNTATELRLRASRALLNQERFAESLNVLEQISPEQFLNHSIQAQYLFLKAVNLVQLQNESAMPWLEQMSSDHLALLNPSDQWIWQRNYAKELIRANKPDEALKSLEFHRPLLSNSESNSLSLFIWNELKTVAPDILSSSLNSSSDSLSKGWLQLALIFKSETSDNYKGLALAQWKKQNPTHPAALNLPESLAELPQNNLPSIKKIALLLPLEGKFANVSKAISQGFLMAAYQLDQDTRPEITVINSLEGEFLQTYDSINADLIIGPLSPNHITQLTQLPSLSTPTIALNSIEAEQSPVNFFYMNLQAEDEATTMARFASRKHLSKGGILTYNSKKGRALANIFQSEFEKNQGRIAVTQGYETNWATSLQKLLEIDKSNYRARKLSQLLRSPIEFTARRREDIEFIYSPLKYQDLRQTNPLMAFFFANNISILANSDISAELHKGKRDKDLEGVIFSDFRWSPEELDIQTLPTKAEAAAKLYAWGADAFQIAFQFPELIALHNHPIHAFGSNIYFDGSSRFIREFPVSYVRYGRPHEIAPAPIKIN